MIFGSTNFTLHHVVYTHTGTKVDEVINYLFALVTLISMFTGIVCNAAVFYYNTVVNNRQVPSIIYRLFLVVQFKSYDQFFKNTLSNII